MVTPIVRVRIVKWGSAAARVVVVGPRLNDRGGIARVNSAYAAAGLFNSDSADLIVRHFPSIRDGLPLGKLVYAGVRLIAFALRSLPPPTVVHLHTTSHGSFWRKFAYSWIARAKGARVIHHIHAFGFLEYYERGGHLRRAAIRTMLRRADALIALTAGMASHLRRIVPEQRIEILPNPVDLVSLRIEPTPLRNPRLVLFLGWLIPEKGIYELLEAVALGLRELPDLRLALGGFRNEVAVHKRVRRLGIEAHVEFRGWLNRVEVASALHECSVLALPSHTEGFGLVLVEAMACGTPIVTCPVGGIPEVVQSPRNAVFVPPRNATALCEALVTVLTDRKLREAMSAAGPRDAERFDTPDVLERLHAIYRRVLTPRASFL